MRSFLSPAYPINLSLATLDPPQVPLCEGSHPFILLQFPASKQKSLQDREPDLNQSSPASPHTQLQLWGERPLGKQTSVSASPQTSRPCVIITTLPAAYSGRLISTLGQDSGKVLPGNPTFSVHVEQSPLFLPRD